MSTLAKSRFRSDTDPREQALYTPAEAACYLGINSQTLSNWLWGRKYPTVSGERHFPPLIRVADTDHRLLSFFNLAELHVLAATRYRHRLSFSTIRAAMSNVQKSYKSAHPLISKDFKTDGRDIFVKTVDETANMSNPDQLNLKSIMDLFLQHVIVDEHDLVRKIFPLIAGQPDDRVISITHGVSSSQPIIDEVGVPVWLIRDRVAAGESPEDLAEDFEVSIDKVHRALDYFEKRAA